MKELATSEETIATEIVANDSTTDIETRNGDNTESCYQWPSCISCVWLFISMLINGLILFAYPALSSYSYGEPIDDYKYEISYVFGFDKYWHHREYEDVAVNCFKCDRYTIGIFDDKNQISNSSNYYPPTQ